MECPEKCHDEQDIISITASLNMKIPASAIDLLKPTRHSVTSKISLYKLNIKINKYEELLKLCINKINVIETSSCEDKINKTKKIIDTADEKILLIKECIQQGAEYVQTGEENIQKAEENIQAGEETIKQFREMLEEIEENIRVALEEGNIDQVGEYIHQIEVLFQKREENINQQLKSKINQMEKMIQGKEILHKEDIKKIHQMKKILLKGDENIKQVEEKIKQLQMEEKIQAEQIPKINLEDCIFFPKFKVVLFNEAIMAKMGNIGLNRALISCYKSHIKQICAAVEVIEFQFEDLNLDLLKEEFGKCKKLMEGMLGIIEISGSKLRSIIQRIKLDPSPLSCRCRICSGKNGPISSMNENQINMIAHSEVLARLEELIINK